MGLSPHTVRDNIKEAHRMARGNPTELAGAAWKMREVTDEHASWAQFMVERLKKRRPGGW